MEPADQPVWWRVSTRLRGASHETVDRVVVTVSGFGLFHHLPFGMRLDSRDGDQVTTSDLLGLFDSEMIRLQYWRDEAPLLFGIGPDRDEANMRWLLLFGFDPELWPKEKHFTLCSLVPTLHRIAGTEDGIRLRVQPAARRGGCGVSISKATTALYRRYRRRIATHSS